MKIWRQAASVCVVMALALLAGQAGAAENPKTGAKDLVLKGDAKCTGCHDESDEPQKSMLDLHPSVLSIGKTTHGAQADSRTPTCTDCHGTSEKHLNFKRDKDHQKPPPPDNIFTKNSPTPAATRDAACLNCHQDGKHTQWQASAHAQRDVACVSCHQVHAEHDKVREKRTQAEVCYACHKQQRADMAKPSRHAVAEGKMACSDCHNPHGSPGPKMLARNSVVETCYTCHMEKRGPFVHSHQPVNDDCSTCHNPHGSTAEGMLKTRAPFLCYECHSTPHPANQLGTGPSGPGAQLYAASSFTQGKACMNCHTQIHGSNNPSNSGTFGLPQRFIR